MIDETKVKETLAKIRPMLQMDGGDIEYVGLDANVVKVKLRGACGGCPGATMTLKYTVERMLRKDVAGDIVVESV